MSETQHYFTMSNYISENNEGEITFPSKPGLTSVEVQIKTRNGLIKSSRNLFSDQNQFVIKFMNPEEARALEGVMEIIETGSIVLVGRQGLVKNTTDLEIPEGKVAVIWGS